MALETDCRFFVEAEKASEMAIDTCVLEQKDYIVGMRRYFHAHPEVSLKEFKTSARIEEELDKVGIEHTRVGETFMLVWSAKSRLRAKRKSWR